MPQLTSLHTSQPHFPPPNQIDHMPNLNFLFQSLTVMTLPNRFTKLNNTLISKALLQTQQVQLASFHLEGIALQWHRWLTKFEGPKTWTEFTKAILVHFGPTDYEDSSETLTRLKKISSVATYQEVFEKLSH